MTLYYGDTYTMKVKNVPNQATVTWSTSKKSIATIDKTGKLTAKKSGSAKITTKVYANGKKIKTLTAKVKVNNPSFQNTKSTLYVGNEKTFSVNKASKAKVTWSSSNPSVVKVNKKGTLTANAAGNVTISAKVTLNKKTTTLKQTVTSKEVALSETSLVMEEKKAVVTLNGATVKSLQYDNTSADCFSSLNKVYLQSKKPCTGDVTVIGKNNKSYELHYTFTANSQRKATINDLTVFTTHPKETLSFKHSYGAWSSDNQIVSCTSADPTIATVTDTGLVTGQKLGDTTVAVTDNYGFTYTANVKVTKPYLEDSDGPIFNRTVTLEGDGEEKQNPNSTSTAIGSGNSSGISERGIVLKGATIQSAVSSDAEAIQISSISQDAIGIRTAFDVYAGSSNITITDTEGNDYVCKVHIKFVPGTYDWYGSLPIYCVKATNQGYILMEQSWRNEKDIPDYSWEPTVTATTENELQAVQDAVTKYEVVANYAALQAEERCTSLDSYLTKIDKEFQSLSGVYNGVTYDDDADYVLARYGQADHNYYVLACQTPIYTSRERGYATNYEATNGSNIIQNFINAHKNDSSYYQYYSWVDYEDFNGNTHSLDEAYQWFLYWTGAKQY